MEIKYILFALGYLLIFSAMVAYFAGAMEADIDFAAPNIVGGYITTHNETNFTAGECRGYTVKEGEWVCTDGVGLVSNDTGVNEFVTTLYDGTLISASNYTYAEKFNIYNPDNLEFNVIIAKAYMWTGGTNTFRIMITDEGMILNHHNCLLPFVCNDFTAGECAAGTSNLTNYYFANQWSMDVGVISIYEDTSGCYMDADYSAIDISSEFYLGGVEVEGQNLTVEWIGESQYETIESSLAKGDWATFFMDILDVLAWKTGEDVMPLVLQVIFIGIPEMFIAISVAAIGLELIPFT